MTFELLKAHWYQHTDEAIEQISKYLTTDVSYEQDFKKLSNWLTYTDINPGSFMPIVYENAKNNPITYLSFLQNVHHAMVDDGNICFVSVEGKEAFILFSHPNDDATQSLVERKLRLLNQSLNHNYEVFEKIAQKATGDIKEKLIETLKNTPRSLKDLKIEFHNDIERFVSEIEQLQNLRQTHKSKKSI